MAKSVGAKTQEIKITPKLAAPALIGLVVLILTNYYGGLTYTTDQRLVFGFVGVLALLGISHFIPKLKFGVAHAPYLYIYHWLLCFAIIFVVPTLSFYLYLWVMLLYMADYYYQRKGFILSSLAFLTAMVIGSIYQAEQVDAKLFVQIGIQLTVILLVNRMMTGFALGNREKRSNVIDKVVQAQDEHDRLVALINSMSDAVIATDDRGVIITYNAAALDILDTNSTLTGKRLSDYFKIFNIEDKPEDIMSIAKKTDYIQRRTDLTMAYGNDDKVALDINISRITKSAVLDRKEGYTFLIRDITQQKSLDDEKELFIHEVSHELRTPITVAEGEMSMAIMMAEKPEPNLAEIKQTINRGHEQVVFLGEMINDLSALSRAKNDSKAVKVEEFSIQEILTELESNYKPQADKKGLYLKVDLAPSIPKITTSRLYFKEILDNFITNAIKYTKKGGITVTGQAIDKDHIMVSVKDTGIGISEEEVNKVYQKFWRSDDPLTRESNGTGLGLYVTKQLANNIGAEIKLESKIKEGSTFSIFITTMGKDKPVSKSQIKRFFKIG